MRVGKIQDVSSLTVLGITLEHIIKELHKKVDNPIDRISQQLEQENQRPQVDKASIQELEHQLFIKQLLGSGNTQKIK